MSLKLSTRSRVAVCGRATWRVEPLKATFISHLPQVISEVYLLHHPQSQNKPPPDIFVEKLWQPNVNHILYLSHLRTASRKVHFVNLLSIEATLRSQSAHSPSTPHGNSYGSVYPARRQHNSTVLRTGRCTRRIWSSIGNPLHATLGHHQPRFQWLQHFSSTEGTT